jgi:Mg2+/Co2+ transporter CorB
MNWDLPDEEAVTVAGLLIHDARRLPDAGQSFTIHGHRMNVLDRKGNQITQLQVWPQGQPTRH